MKFLTALILLFYIPGFSQTPNHSINNTTLNKLTNGLSSSHNSFIENIGQYGETITGHEKLGKMRYGFEGFGMPVLSTPKGLIHMHRKVEKKSKQEENKLEK